MTQNDAIPAARRVALAREPGRPGVSGAVQTLFTDFFEQRGDRLCADDPAVLTGVGLFHGRPVTVLGTRKGADLEENLACHFGMPTPEGYRKALRAMEQAEKFGRPLLTFVDTPGAYPGLEAEARGQGAAIAACLARMSTLSVPLVAVILGEGGSGGALALAMGNRVLMAENAVYSVLSPEGFASILWKDSSRAGEACGLMKLTAADLLELQVIDRVLPEPDGGAHTDPAAFWRTVDAALREELRRAEKLADPARHRQRRFRAMGNGWLSAGKETI